MLRPLTILAAVGLIALAPAAQAKIGQELHISASGEVHLINAELVTKHALNLLAIEVWEQRWTIPIDQFTKLESAYGAPISLAAIETGHSLEIQGKPFSGKTGWLDARLVRDLSVKTGTPPIAPPPAPALLPARPPVMPPSFVTPPTPPPPPPPPPASTAPPLSQPQPESTAPHAAASASGPPRLTQYLRPGMRGPEVVILQEFLQKNGWGIPDNGPVTGYYGNVTASAVMAFQRKNGLPPEGVVGPRTRSLINALLGR